MRKSRRIRNRILRAIIIPGMMAIDYWVYIGTTQPPSQSTMIPGILAIISHFTVGGYYHRLADKGNDDRPYGAYGLFGAFFPYLAVIFVEEFKGKAQKIIDNSMMWGVLSIGAALIISVIVSLFI